MSGANETHTAASVITAFQLTQLAFVAPVNGDFPNRRC